MHLAVCIKQIPDPEVPPSDFRLDPKRREAAPGHAPLVINIFDENALEVALQLREKAGRGKITALSLGAPTAIDVLRKALAMGGDEAILIPEGDFPRLDSYAAARILAAAILRLEPVDLVLCGREAGDWHGGQLGAFLAAELGRPFVGFVAAIRKEGERLHMRRQTEDGWDVVECSLPAVATVTNDDGNVPRIPKVRNSMLAFRKTIPIWTAETLGLDAASVAGPNAELETIEVYIPTVARQCQTITGKNGQEKAVQLVSKLAALHII